MIRDAGGCNELDLEKVRSFDIQRELGVALLLLWSQLKGVS